MGGVVRGTVPCGRSPRPGAATVPGRPDCVAGVPVRAGPGCGAAAGAGVALRWRAEGVQRGFGARETVPGPAGRGAQLRRAGGAADRGAVDVAGAAAVVEPGQGGDCPVVA